VACWHEPEPVIRWFCRFCFGDLLQAAELEAKLSKLTTAEPAEEAGSDDDDDDFGLSITAAAGKKKSGAKKGGKGKKKPAKKGEPCIRDCGCRRLPR